MRASTNAKQHKAGTYGALLLRSRYPFAEALLVEQIPQRERVVVAAVCGHVCTYVGVCMGVPQDSKVTRVNSQSGTSSQTLDNPVAAEGPYILAT